MTALPLHRQIHQQKRRSCCSNSSKHSELVESIYIGEFHAFRLFTASHGMRSDKLRGNILLKQHLLEVDLRHVGLFNDELAHAIQDRPADVLPLVRYLRSLR